MPLRTERLKQLRQKRGFTQDELADRAGVHLRAIQRYEAGETEPSLDVALRLARALETTTDYLGGETDDPVNRIDDDSLSTLERLVLSLLRRGEALEAIRIISEQASGKPR
jgi:transcriptional regulator with XRE-family HTH domain